MKIPTFWHSMVSRFNPAHILLFGLWVVPYSGRAQSANALSGTAPGPVQMQSQNPGVNDPTGTDALLGVTHKLNAGRNPDATQQQRAARLGNAAPSEFQKVVQATTGEELPIFGANLFGDTPSTFALVDDAPVTPDYVVGPGDELRIQIWGQVNQAVTQTVDRSGQIHLASIGPVHVAGIQFSQLRDFLISQVSRVSRNFDLNVNMGQLRSIQVFVVGQAREPGSYAIGSLSTLLNAVFASGGPTPQGSLRDIQVRRGNKTLVHFDLYDLLLSGDKSRDVPLESGDVIFIPKVGPQVAILGSVTEPAIYELRSETNFAQAIALAGGPTSAAAGNNVRVDRITNHEDRGVLDLTLTGLESNPQPVQTGDIITIGSVVNKFTNAVTLRGNVTNPGRYQWHAGMHLLDLIPNRDALITRTYYDRTGQLAHAASDYAAPPQEGQISTAAGAMSRANGTNRGSASTNGSGAAVSQTLNTRTDNFRPQTDVLLQAPDVNWDYAIIQRQNKQDLTTSLVPFNLGKLINDHDMAQNLELEPGDVVSIFSKADVQGPIAEQTRYVHLEGEFVAAGVYSALPGETLRQLIRRVGGFTPNAYLYGSQFTRVSTQRLQKQRLQDYADALDAQISAQTSSGISSSLNDRDAASTQANSEIAHAVVNRLRQANPAGRIVMDVKYENAGIDSIPDLDLENGDRFIVPKPPSSVTVEGQVYSANAFVWQPKHDAGFYLHVAGGPDRSADTRREYILRADGSVLGGGYHDIRGKDLYPGDTVVVPPVIQKNSVLRQFADISQILSGFGLAAAAIEVLK